MLSWSIETFLVAGFAKLPEDRVRYWNAYLLFYEQRVNLRTVGNRRSSRLQVLRKSQTTVSGSRQDSLSELSDLVHQGEKQVSLSFQPIQRGSRATAFCVMVDFRACSSARCLEGCSEASV